MNEKDEKALIAILATILHPDAHRELTRQEINVLVANTEDISKMERDVFEAIDPISLIKDPVLEDKTIRFPTLGPADDLPTAVGFYRRGNEKSDDPDTRDSVRKMREAIRQELMKKQKDSDVAFRDD